MSNYRLDVQFEVVIDIKTAYDRYEDQREGLGDELIEEIESCYSLISEYPEHYGFLRISGGNTRYRRIKLHRFPYIIVYEISTDIVVVSRLRHVKQDWQLT